MNEFREGIKAGRSAVAKRRLLVAIVPLVLVGVFQVVRAARRDHVSDAIAYGLIFWVICPIFAFWWSRRHKSRSS